MSKISPLLLIPPVIFAAMAGLFAVGMMRDNPGELPSALIGQAPPALADEAVLGTQLVMPRDFQTGEVTIVNFWASWCPPCRAEHPTLLRLAAEGHRIVGANFRDQADQAARYLVEDGNPFIATSFDQSGRKALDWGVSAPPETFVVGKGGRILHRFTGPLVGSDFEQRFLPMLEDALGQ